VQLSKNVAGQKWTVFAFNRTTNAPVTGDAANITAKLSKDWGTLAAIVDTNPTEIEDGYYRFDLTQEESNASVLNIFPESTTAGVQVIGVPGTISTEEVSTGTGARVVQITVNDGANLLEGARVRVTKGAESYVCSTDSLGRVNSGSGFSLDDGTWAISISLAGYTFTPTTLVVDGTESQTYSMTAETIPASSDSLITGYSYCYDHEGVVEADVEIEMRLDELTGTGVILDTATRTETSSVTGLVAFTNIFPGGIYRMRRGKGRGWKRVVIPSTATSPYALPDFWGED
jgi:hypothetical protein